MMFYLAFTALLSLLPAVLGQVLSTSSRWIVDGNGDRVKLRCVNWAGHMEAQIPEGLQYQSVDYIASWIQKNNFNCVRLTYSIDTATNPGQLVSDALTSGLGGAGVSSSDVSSLWTKLQATNPFLSSATTLSTFAAVIDALHERGVMTILDNHVSHASWCCSTSDGNGFWDQADGYNDDNSRYFDTNAWLQGLGAMASFAGQHPGVVGMSIRNELRAYLLQVLDEYGSWYDYVSRGAQAIHSANPDLLIMVGGLSYAVDLSFLGKDPLDTSGWPSKTVWEAHSYSWSFNTATSDCQSFQNSMGDDFGYLVSQGQSYTGPLWVSEFGVGQTGGPDSGLSASDSYYLTCLVQYLSGNDADWAVWALQGSYYIRQGTLDSDESFGLLTHDFSDWRNPQFPGLLGAMWNQTQGP